MRFCETYRLIVLALFRIRLLRQSSLCSHSNTGHEWLPDRHETPQGAAEAAQTGQALLDRLCTEPLFLTPFIHSLLHLCFLAQYQKK